MYDPKLINRKKNKLSEWVSIFEDKVMDINGKIDLYHSISVPDYVCILAIDKKGYVPLVRQFRHAVNEITLELPAGLCEGGQEPKEVALKELYEETGHKYASQIKELISLRPCTGRLTNKCWCFYLENAIKDKQWVPEKGVKLEMTKSSKLTSLIDNGHIQNSMHVATIYKAINSNLIK